MANDDNNQPLLQKLLNLAKTQQNFQAEIQGIQQRLQLLNQNQEKIYAELNQLHTEITAGEKTENVPLIKANPPAAPQTTESAPRTNPFPFPMPPNETPTPNPPLQAKIKRNVPNDLNNAKQTNLPAGKSNIEKFIGENIISLVGIIITIIGVAIGAKYAIDNNLISPPVRIAAGYGAGLILLVFALRLRAKYLNFSAVLLSGAMAILYFITFAAYSFYDLMPPLFAFGLMFILTILTVFAALIYNRQVIAHIGLVGAYAVPFLVGGNSGNTTVLFSYIAIINTGILVVALKKYWKALDYSAFVFTWLIFLAWFGLSYRSENFNLAFLFAAIYFVIFYATLIAGVFRRNAEVKAEDVLLLLPNAFIFYGIGYALLSENAAGNQFLGLFTFANAVIHAAVGLVIYRTKLVSQNIFYLIIGLALTFLTIAIPVQFRGNWVTLLWAGEAVILFWIGRTGKVAFYEIASYFLGAAAFLSLLLDWARQAANFNENFVPVFNPTFLTAAIFTGAVAFLIYTNRHNAATGNKVLPAEALHFVFSTLFLFTLYAAFFLQIVGYFEQIKSVYQINYANIPLDYNNPDALQRFKYIQQIEFYILIWLINYSLFFFTLLSFSNLKILKSRMLGLVNLGFISLAVFIFLTLGLIAFGEVREFSNLQLTEIVSSYQFWLRYISLAFLGAAIYACYGEIRQSYFGFAAMKIKPLPIFEILLHIVLVWILSNELMNWLETGQFQDTDKLGLSILWGIYSLGLIILGIAGRKKYLRILAIALFAVTLGKLFFYDIAALNTISKTIVFVALGVLLLIISFLYYKFKLSIFSESGESKESEESAEI